MIVNRFGARILCFCLCFLLLCCRSLSFTISYFFIGSFSDDYIYNTNEEVENVYSGISLEDSTATHRETLNSINSLQNMCWYNDSINVWQNFYLRDIYGGTIAMTIISEIFL
jgi:hypothetical protein